MSLRALLRTKSIEQLQTEIGRAGQFRRGHCHITK